jgi:hypothetical protein
VWTPTGCSGYRRRSRADAIRVLTNAAAGVNGNGGDVDKGRATSFVFWGDSLLRETLLHLIQWLRGNTQYHDWYYNGANSYFAIIGDPDTDEYKDEYFVDRDPAKAAAFATQVRSRRRKCKDVFFEAWFAYGIGVEKAGKIMDDWQRLQSPKDNEVPMKANNTTVEKKRRTEI